MSQISAVLITGASTGIGATYAERFARRGHDLVLVARDATRMETLASRLRQETGVTIDILPADLIQTADIVKVRPGCVTMRASAFSSTMPERRSVEASSTRASMT